MCHRINPPQISSLLVDDAISEDEQRPRITADLIPSRMHRRVNDSKRNCERRKYFFRAVPCLIDLWDDLPSRIRSSHTIQSQPAIARGPTDIIARHTLADPEIRRDLLGRPFVDPAK
jgi:hypothetical protein